MAQTLSEKLTAAIREQQAEVDRLQAVVTAELPAAKAKLNTLQSLLGNLTTPLETAIGKLKANGIKLDD